MRHTMSAHSHHAVASAADRTRQVYPIHDRYVNQRVTTARSAGRSAWPVRLIAVAQVAEAVGEFLTTERANLDAIVFVKPLIGLVIPLGAIEVAVKWVEVCSFCGEELA